MGWMFVAGVGSGVGVVVGSGVEAVVGSDVGGFGVEPDIGTGVC